MTTDLIQLEIDAANAMCDAALNGERLTWAQARKKAWLVACCGVQE